MKKVKLFESSKASEYLQLLMKNYDEFVVARNTK